MELARTVPLRTIVHRESTACVFQTRHDHCSEIVAKTQMCFEPPFPAQEGMHTALAGLADLAGLLNQKQHQTKTEATPWAIITQNR